MGKRKREAELARLSDGAADVAADEVLKLVEEQVERG